MYEVYIKNFFNLDYQRSTAAISVFFLWLKAIEWLSLFEKTAFYMHLIKETLTSILEFLIIMFVLYMMFGSTIYILNLGLPPEEAIMRSIFDLWILDAFQSQYEMSIGEYQIDAYGATGAQQRKFLATFFLLSTFMIMIVFLNMLIAIMGDAFDQAKENEVKNRKLNMLKIMGEYVYLTQQYGDVERVDQYVADLTEEQKEKIKAKIRSTSLDLPEDETERESLIEEKMLDLIEADMKKEKKYEKKRKITGAKNFLYIV